MARDLLLGHRTVIGRQDRHVGQWSRHHCPLRVLFAGEPVLLPRYACAVQCV
jgi:hypothetical protein